MEVKRITENELKHIVECSVNKILRESIDMGREIRLAQKSLYKMGQMLSDVGLRLNGTPYYKQFLQMKDAMIKLNDMLIAEIRKEKRP